MLTNEEDFMLHKYVIPICLLFLMLNGCNPKVGSTAPFAYVGGEIINPKNNIVVLYNTDGKLTDSIKLDVNNRFLHKIENLNPGLYSITHGGEYQMILLEPSDSIMFRLNTFDFDESLVFTGNGANKNNYLIKTYLSNEIEGQKLVKYAKMEPERFNAFVEKRRLSQLEDFHEFLAKNEESEFFKSIVEANINYNSYADKEIYPFAYFGNNKLIHVKDLPEEFYAYRENVNYNAEELSHLFAYNRFLFSHVDNLALNSYYQNNEFHSTFNRHCLTYNKTKLDLVDSIIENETIKNNLLKYKARDYISHYHTEEEAQDLLAYYLNKSSNETDKSEMQDLVESMQALRQGNPIPNLTVVNYDNSEHDLKSVIRKPSIIYFWSSHYKKQYRNSHYVVNQLKEQFSYMDFISINVNDNDDKYWRDIIGNYNFPKTYEFKFKNSKEALKTLAVNYLNKAIIVDEKGNILHPNVNIFSSDFDETLTELTQKKRLIQ